MNDLSDREERPERPVEADGTAHLFRALGKQIKTLREAAGLLQKELATRLNVGEDLIGAIERGVRTPSRTSWNERTACSRREGSCWWRSRRSRRR